MKSRIKLTTDQRAVEIVNNILHSAVKAYNDMPASAKNETNRKDVQLVESFRIKMMYSLKNQ